MERYSEYRDSGEQWLGEIPSHWECQPIRYIFSQRNECVGKQSDKFTLLSLTLNGVIKRDMENPTGKFPSSFDTYKKVRKGDFIFCMFDNEETPRAFGLSHLDGMITGAYDVMHLDSKLYLESYLNYYFLNIDNQKGLKPLYKGLRKTVPLDAFLSLKIMLPPLSEQSAIVAYLDRVTSQLDEAIAQQQRMIDLLNERKQIIIQHAVTKGLDPNAEMVDSGVEWIGRMPKGWKLQKLKYCCSIKGRVGWNGLSSDEYQEQGYAYLVTGQDFRGKKIDWRKCFQINKKRYDEDPYIQLNNGDLLVTKDGSIGKIAKVQDLDKPACLNSGIFILKQKENLYIQDYLFWMLNSRVLKEFNRFTQTGATILHLYQNVFENMPCIIPPSEVQEGIATYLNSKCAILDDEIQRHSSKITLLRERKQIIINEVVTGKVKVS